MQGTVAEGSSMTMTANDVKAAGMPVWMQIEEVCRAAVGVGIGRKAVAGLAAVLRQAGEAGAPEGLAERLADLVLPPRAEAGSEAAWITLMRTSGKVTEEELRAAREILYVMRLRIEVSGGAIRAVDPSRLVVDGGALPGARLAGMPLDPAVERFDRWVEEVRRLDMKQRIVRGRKDNVSLLGLVQRVLVCGDGPNGIDKDIGVRNGRCGEVVRRELKRYAELNFRP